MTKSNALTLPRWACGEGWRVLSLGYGEVGGSASRGDGYSLPFGQAFGSTPPFSDTGVEWLFGPPEGVSDG